MTPERGADEEGEEYVQLYVYKGKRLVLRAPPRSPPTEAQKVVRAMFGDAARSARGRRRGDGLPPAAEEVRAVMTGQRTGVGREETRVWVRRMIDDLMRQGLTEQQALEALEEWMEEWLREQ